MLKSSKRVQRNLRLLALLSSDEVLRVGGRLKHAVLPEKVKHPIILPLHHYFTRLIIVYYHKKLFQAEVQTTRTSQ